MGGLLMNQRRAPKREAMSLDVFWSRVFAISAFTFELLSPEVRDCFKRENAALEKAANRWLDKLYSRPKQLD
jgi:hypothetical protein